VIVSVAVLLVGATDAVILEVTVLVTAMLVTVNVADVLPARMMTVAGTDASPLELDSKTVNPTGGAGVPIDTVAFAVLPPTIEVGLSVRDSTAGGFMVSEAVSLVPFSSAEMITGVGAATETVLTVKVAVDFPAGTVTEVGVVADDELLVISTTNPPMGAAPVSVMVPVQEDPPIRLVTLSFSDISSGGLIVRVAVSVTAPSSAVIKADLVVATARVFTVNEDDDLPAAIVTLAGTTADVVPLESLTTRPPVGAMPVSVTVPRDDVPPATVVGDKDID